MTAEISREVVRAPLPDLNTGPEKTTHSALHEICYLGRLVEWDSFQRDASQHFDNTDWNRHRQILTHRTTGEPSQASLTREHFHCGDETGVRSRFTQNIGHVMSAVSVAMGVDLVFADYKAIRGPAVDRMVPDFVCMTGNGWLRILGEIKTRWVDDHDLELARHNGGWAFRNILGQISLYMRVSHMKYAFISNYEQTIFLKQEYQQGQWTLHHNTVVYHNAQRTTPGAHINGNVSLRQCMWYIMHLAGAAHFVANNTPVGQWANTR